jgi:hypothetical protein
VQYRTKGVKILLASRRGNFGQASRIAGRELRMKAGSGADVAIDEPRRAASMLASFLATALVLASSANQTALAEDAPGRSLYLELNAAQPSDKGCRFTFVVTNDLGADLSAAAFELVLFDAQGVVDRLSVLEFRDMPKGKTKVSRFDLAGVDCGKIGRILVNAATQCAGEGIAASDCMKGIRTASKATIAFGV